MASRRPNNLDSILESRRSMKRSSISSMLEETGAVGVTWRGSGENRGHGGRGGWGERSTALLGLGSDWVSRE